MPNWDEISLNLDCFSSSLSFSLSLSLSLIFSFWFSSLLSYCFCFFRLSSYLCDFCIFFFSCMLPVSLARAVFIDSVLYAFTDFSQLTSPRTPSCKHFGPTKYFFSFHSCSLSQPLVQELYSSTLYYVHYWLFTS